MTKDTPEDQRALLDECTRDMFTCHAQLHLSDCPWHPDNVDVTYLSADQFDRLMAELDEPPKVNPRLQNLFARTDERYLRRVQDTPLPPAAPDEEAP